MPGFIRRFGYQPGTETITQIEGVAIIDLPPPGSIQGINTGVVAMVGEFADMCNAVSVDGNGVVTTKTVPKEVFSSADMLTKFGNFDPTLGDFGRAGGNGFAELRNKAYSRLILAAVNLASNVGARFFRALPLCTSQSDTLPAVPVQGGVVTAGREFRNATGGRVLAAKRIAFTALDAITSAVAGQLLAGSSAATQTLVSSSQALQVWQVSSAGTVFGDQTANFNDAAVNYLPFNASETVADYAAFGMASTFGKLTFSNVGGTQGAGGVVVWEYWNGSAWTALSGITDGTSGFTAALGAGQTVTWTIPSNWASNALNSVTAYYVRARLTTVYTTNPSYTQGFVNGVDWSTIARPDGDIGAKKGDIVVIGYNNAGAIAPAAEGGTYRVATTPSAGVNLSVERLDGANFTWTAQANVPWRLHVSSDADSAPVFVLGATGAGGYDQNDPGGFSVPVRPVTNATGGTTDGSYTIAELLVPAVVPPALTGDTADPLANLQARLHPTVAMTFVAAVQGLNAPNHASIDALYSVALESLISDLTPVSDINIVFTARSSDTIRTLVKAHVLKSSAIGLGKIGIVGPLLTTTDIAVVVGSAAPGVGATRDERIVYTWPGARTYIPEAVGVRLRLANGLTTADGVLDVGFASWIASLMSNLPPERNIGQGAAPVPQVLVGVLGIQNGVNTLNMSQYINLRDRGVAALRMDRALDGPVVQSGITSSLVAGQKNISRRRMADFIQDSASKRLVQFCKLPKTQSNKDAAVGEIDTFLQDLLSTNNPAAQRIDSYVIDDTSGNTPALDAIGAFVIIIKVKLTPTMDFIVLQAEIGEGVVTTTELAAA